MEKSGGSRGCALEFDKKGMMGGTAAAVEDKSLIVDLLHLLKI